MELLVAERECKPSRTAAYRGAWHEPSSNVGSAHVHGAIKKYGGRGGR